jgi:YcaO-like protein with predicted kinase domain
LNGLRTCIGASLERIAAIDFCEASESELRDEDVDRLVEAIGITRIAWTTRLDRLCVPTLYCVRPAALHPCAIYSSGKAFEPRPALLSSVFESYERWAAERAAFCLEASPDDLFENSRELGLTVFEPSDARSAAPIRWALGRNLGSSAFAAIPAGYVEFPPETSTDQQFTTTGLAAHVTFSEAASNALLECVERHATAALTSRNIFRVAAADFSTRARCLADTFAREDIELHTFVIGSDARFKTAYCYAYDHWLGVPQIHCSGFGASTCVAAAVDKAMLEVVQSRAAMISGLRDDVAVLASGRKHDEYRENVGHLTWLEQLRGVTQAFVTQEFDTQVFDSRAAKPEQTEGLHEVLANFAASDRAALVFPLRTAAGLAAVRAIVPGLDDCC